MTIDTLKQAAQALRDTKPELAAALEAMANVEPVAWLDDGSTLNGTRTTSHRVVTTQTLAEMPRAVAAAYQTPLYAAPIATPEHDAKVIEEFLKRTGQWLTNDATHKKALADARNEGLEEAAKVCDRSSLQPIIAARIRALKSTGADHAN